MVWPSACCVFWPSPHAPMPRSSRRAPSAHPAVPGEGEALAPSPAPSHPAEDGDVPLLGEDLETMAAIIHDLAVKQQRLSAYIDAGWESDALPVAELVRLMALHAQNASRLARLLRDKRALSGQAADGIAGAIAQALDELSTEWGIPL